MTPTPGIRRPLELFAVDDRLRGPEQTPVAQYLGDQSGPVFLPIFPLETAGGCKA
jgi:hypothetical protein